MSVLNASSPLVLRLTVGPIYRRDPPAPEVNGQADETEQASGEQEGPEDGDSHASPVAFSSAARSPEGPGTGKLSAASMTACTFACRMPKVCLALRQ